MITRKTYLSAKKIVEDYEKKKLKPKKKILNKGLTSTQSRILNHKIEKLWLEVEPYVCNDHVPPKKISPEFHKWYKRMKDKFNNEWDVYSIVKRFFSNNRNYVPTKVPRP